VKKIFLHIVMNKMFTVIYKWIEKLSSSYTSPAIDHPKCCVHREEDPGLGFGKGS